MELSKLKLFSRFKKDQPELFSINEEQNIVNNVESNIVVDGIIGFAIGDALGVPVEFMNREVIRMNPVVDMREFGTHNMPIGTWSDDTSMTIATMDSICEHRDINYDDMMIKFSKWLGEAKYTATDIVFDVGISTNQAIINYVRNNIPATNCGPTGEQQNGNGSLMRMLPIALYCYYNNLTEQKETELINNFSSLTHGHEISKLGCKIYSDFIKYLLTTGDKDKAYKELVNKDYSKYYNKNTIDKYRRILDGNLKEIKIDNINSSGYIISTLEASLWCTLNSNSYEEAVLKAVNLGSDTDTVGGITGGINGIIYGINRIPYKWLNVLKKKDYLIDLSNKYYNVINKMCLKMDNNKKIR